MKDGHINSCKVCRNAYAKVHREKNPDYYIQFEKNRRDLPHRKELAEKIQYRYRENYPLRARANNLLNKAVRMQKIIKEPCFVCGSTYVVGHHVDYQKPLDVVWLCQKHHKEIHKCAL